MKLPLLFRANKPVNIIGTFGIQSVCCCGGMIGQLQGAAFYSLFYEFWAFLFGFVFFRAYKILNCVYHTSIVYAIKSVCQLLAERFFPELGSATLFFFHVFMGCTFYQ